MPPIGVTMNDSPLQWERDQLQIQYNEIAALAGGLAHEIRNPLSTIRLNLDLLFEDLQKVAEPQGGRMLRKLERIRTECGHLDEILESFLQFAQAGEIHLEERDLGHIVRDFVDYHRPEAQQHGIELRLYVAGDLPKVHLDPRLFRHVLTNLFKNAVQAMPQGGTIEIQISRRGKWVCLEIVDSGIGIPQQAVEKVFQVFFSTKPGGSGLGLPTARKIVEAHHGTIACESEVGRGTRFTIRLPVME